MSAPARPALPPPSGVDARLLREAVAAFQPRARAAVLGGSLLYGLSSPASDLDIWVFHCLPVRAFLGLKDPPLIASKRARVGGARVDMRAVDIKALALSWVEGGFYEIEHLFSPGVLFGGEWLEALRAQARRHASRRARASVAKRASLETRFADQEPGRSASARLHALRVLLAGVWYLKTGGEVVSDIGALNGLLLNSERVAGVVELVRSGAQAHVQAPPEWLGELDREIERARARLAEAFEASPLPGGEGMEPGIEHALRQMRLEMDEPAPKR